MGNFNTDRFASKTIEWATPANVFDPLNSEFRFTLDVCANSENSKCPAFYDMEKNGLAQQWVGTCWMNPPYGREMTEWLRKAIAERENGVTTVALIPARTNTGWWHDLVIPNGEVRFLRGRPKFVGAKHGLPFPLAIVVFRAAQPALAAA